MNSKSPSVSRRRLSRFWKQKEGAALFLLCCSAVAVLSGFISPEVGDDPEKVALVVPLLAKVSCQLCKTLYLHIFAGTWAHRSTYFVGQKARSVRRPALRYMFCPLPPGGSDVSPLVAWNCA